MNFTYDVTPNGLYRRDAYTFTAIDISSLYVPTDEYIQIIEACVQQKKPHTDSLWIIGIGGSNMGALALYNALEYAIDSMPIHWIDTIDPVVTHASYAQFTAELQAGKNPLVVVISKSGRTLETAINSEIFITQLSRFRCDYAQYVVVITDAGSPLYREAQHKNFSILEIPRSVGGRFSVFTAVGLFPLAMQGISIRELCKGAADARANKEERYHAHAAIMYEQYTQGKNIYDIFVFNPQLKALGLWYRQLIGESLGKNLQGMTPTVSVGTIDLHSVVQLNLAGPRDKFTCFIWGTSEISEQLLWHTKTLANIQEAFFEGTCRAYKKQNIPFVQYRFALKPYECAFFMQLKMKEVIQLAALLGVNPFDQPEVELYKSEVREILDGPKV